MDVVDTDINTNMDTSTSTSTSNNSKSDISETKYDQSYMKRKMEQFNKNEHNKQNRIDAAKKHKVEIQRVATDAEQSTVNEWLDYLPYRSLQGFAQLCKVTIKGIDFMPLGRIELLKNIKCIKTSELEEKRIKYTSKHGDVIIGADVVKDYDRSLTDLWYRQTWEWLQVGQIFSVEYNRVVDFVVTKRYNNRDQKYGGKIMAQVWSVWKQALSDQYIPETYTFQFKRNQWVKQEPFSQVFIKQYRCLKETIKQQQQSGIKFQPFVMNLTEKLAQDLKQNGNVGREIRVIIRSTSSAGSQKTALLVAEVGSSYRRSNETSLCCIGSSCCYQIVTVNNIERLIKFEYGGTENVRHELHLQDIYKQDARRMTTVMLGTQDKNSSLNKYMVSNPLYDCNLFQIISHYMGATYETNDEDDSTE